MDYSSRQSQDNSGTKIISSRLTINQTNTIDKIFIREEIRQNKRVEALTNNPL